jgi:hypothetical protein
LIGAVLRWLHGRAARRSGGALMNDIAAIAVIAAAFACFFALTWALGKL